MGANNRTNRQRLDIVELADEISGNINDAVRDFLTVFQAYSPHKESASRTKKSEWWQSWEKMKEVPARLLLLFISPVIGILELVTNILESESFFSALKNIAEGLLIAAPLFLLAQTVGLLRDLTVIAATPLTWFVKKPLRYLWTGLRDLLGLEKNYDGMNFFDDRNIGYNDSPELREIKTLGRNIYSSIGGMINDFLNTLKPYPRTRAAIHEKTSEWLQLYNGIENAVGGIQSIISSPFLILPNLYSNIVNSPSFGATLKNIALSLVLFPLRVLNGVVGIMRGVTQIVTAPLAWVIKKPLRHFLTGVRNHLNSDLDGRTFLQNSQIRNMGAITIKLLTDMLTDLKDTFKAYPKNGKSKKAEWRQPLEGFKNLLGGLFLLIVSPLMGLNQLYENLFNSKSFSSALKNTLAGLFIASPLYLLSSVAHIVRGATRIAAAPLTWFVKKPLRYLWTGLRDFFDDRGASERRSSVQLKIGEAEELLKTTAKLLDPKEDLDSIHSKLDVAREKYKLAVNNNQKTSISSDVEDSHAKECEKSYMDIEKGWDISETYRQQATERYVNAACAYIKLFDPKFELPAPQEETLVPEYQYSK